MSDNRDHKDDERGQDRSQSFCPGRYSKDERQYRNQQEYKGIMALIYKEDSKDFVRGTTMDVIRSVEDTPDIHHIFPEAYCIRKKYPKEKWNSIVNKTPLLPASNRQIGGDAPSVYSKRIKTKARIDEAKYRSRIESHLIDYSSFIRDDFDTYFILRAKALLRIIESAMGKKVPDRASEQTIYGLKHLFDDLCRQIHTFAVVASGFGEGYCIPRVVIIGKFIMLSAVGKRKPYPLQKLP